MISSAKYGASRGRLDFAGFAQRCFHELNPQTDFAMNWHVRVIAAKLVALGQSHVRKRLLELSSLSKLDKRGSLMRYVSATDAKQRLAALLDAAQREPVMIRRQNRDVAVLLSPQEYDRLRALNTDEFQRFCDRIGERAAAQGMTEEKLAEILADES
jgi:antitoxin Phd